MVIKFNNIFLLEPSVITKALVSIVGYLDNTCAQGIATTAFSLLIAELFFKVMLCEKTFCTSMI